MNELLPSALAIIGDLFACYDLAPSVWLKVISWILPLGSSKSELNAWKGHGVQLWPRLSK